MLLWVSLTLLHVSPICSPYSSWLITCTSNFSSVLIASHWFFTWLVLGDIRLCFSLTIVRISSAVEEEMKWALWLYHQCIQNIHVTNGITVISLCASLLQKKRAATDRLCQIALNRILLCKFEKWYKFSCHVKVKLHTMRPACISFHSFNSGIV
jgi:hypothetical protein